MIALVTSVVFGGRLQALSAAEKTEEEWNVREAVFRYQINQAMSGYPPCRVFYLAIVYGDDKRKECDPPEDFMWRFSGNNPTVKKVSKCTFRFHDGVVDNKTGEHGVILYTSKIMRISDTDAAIYGEPCSGQEGVMYHLEKVHGKWQVIIEHMIWIY